MSLQVYLARDKGELAIIEVVMFAVSLAEKPGQLVRSSSNFNPVMASISSVSWVGSSSST